MAGLLLSPLPATAQGISQQGNLVYLENDQQVRIGIRLDWGGVIVEVSQGGENFVDHNDLGRDIQLALFDGNASYQADIFNNNIGFNPTQGGDIYNHGSPVVAQSFADGVLYTKTQPIEWNPDNKGGGPTTPVLSDIFMEQWISFLISPAGVIHVHYKVSHFGTDVHAVVNQALPAIYTQATYDRFITYAGSDPWQNGPETAATLSVIYDVSKTPVFRAAENWVATVTASNQGLTAFVPDAYPFFSGIRLPPEAQNPSNAMSTIAFVSLLPGAQIESDYYLIPGDYRAARQAIYQIEATRLKVDVMAPFGGLGGAGCAPLPPNRSVTISGAPVFSGFGFDNVGVTGVDYFVDGVLRGHATYGSPQPGVAGVWPGLTDAPNFGFSFALDTSQYLEGAHFLEVRLRDQAGNLGILPRLRFKTTDLNVVRRAGIGSDGDSTGRLPIVLSARRNGDPNAYGSFDLIDSTGAALGWAVDPDVLPSSIRVRFYVDGPSGLGTLAGTVVANVARPSLNTGCGFDGNHGFSFSMPPDFRDGRTHSVYAYGVDETRGAEVLLPGSPQSFSGH